MQNTEQLISAEIAGLSAALETARAKGDEKSIFKLAQVLKSTRNEHRLQSDALLKAEARVILLEKNRGALVELDAAKQLITKVLSPLLIFVRKLPDSAESEGERVKLAFISEAALAVIRTSCTELQGEV